MGPIGRTPAPDAHSFVPSRYPVLGPLQPPTHPARGTVEQFLGSVPPHQEEARGVGGPGQLVWVCGEVEGRFPSCCDVTRPCRRGAHPGD